LAGFRIDVVPVRPPVAGGRVFYHRADLVDGPAPPLVEQRAVGGDGGGDIATLAEVERLPRLEQAVFQQRAEGHAPEAALAPGRLEDRVRVGRRGDRVDARARHLDVGRVALDADPMAVQLLGDRAGRAGAEER